MIPVWLHPRQWEKVLAPIRSTQDTRDPDLADRLCDQFMITEAQRYASYTDARTNRLITWCNIASWDISLAFSAEIPHWVQRDGKRVELSANDTYDWLKKEGPSFNWLQVLEAEARAHANSGRPAVASHKNPTGGSGHIAFLRRRRPTSPEGTYVIQAGKLNFGYGLLSLGFGSADRSFFIHP